MTNTEARNICEECGDKVATRKYLGKNLCTFCEFDEDEKEILNKKESAGFEAQNTQVGGSNTAKILKISDAEYFAYPALSQSTLKRYLESPTKAQAEPSEISKEAKAFGDALEVAIFDGIEALNLKYTEVEHKTYCPTMYKDLEIYNEKNKTNKKPLTKAHFDALKDVLKSLDNSTTAKSLIAAPGELQLVLIWEKDGTKRKAKLDKIIRVGAKLIILDTKSFAAKKSISDQSLAYHCKDYGYDIQAAFYTEGAIETGLAKSIDNVVFVNLFVEKSTNPEIIPAVISDNNLEAARKKIEFGAQLYKEAQQTKITASDVILRKQNALSGEPSNFVTLSWFDDTIPEILL